MSAASLALGAAWWALGVGLDGLQVQPAELRRCLQEDTDSAIA